MPQFITAFALLMTLCIQSYAYAKTLEASNLSNGGNQKRLVNKAMVFFVWMTNGDREWRKLPCQKPGCHVMRETGLIITIQENFECKMNTPTTAKIGMGNDLRFNNVAYKGDVKLERTLSYGSHYLHFIPYLRPLGLFVWGTEDVSFNLKFNCSQIAGFTTSSQKISSVETQAKLVDNPTKSATEQSYLGRHGTAIALSCTAIAICILATLMILHKKGKLQCSKKGSEGKMAEDCGEVSVKSEMSEAKSETASAATN